MPRGRHLHRVVRLLVGLVEPHADERGKACEHACEDASRRCGDRDEHVAFNPASYVNPARL